MIDFNASKTPILYRAEHLDDGPLGPREIHYFYPQGEWDGWRRRAETSEAAYPQAQYQWVDIDSLVGQRFAANQGAAEKPRAAA
jgi:kynureninase